MFYIFLLSGFRYLTRLNPQNAFDFGGGSMSLSTKTTLLSGVALALATLLPAAAHAQQADEPVAAAEEGAEIVVLGRGETRQVQTLSQSDLELSTPGASPIKELAKLPSVNFQSSDAMGLNEYSSNISVRSFGQSQLGYTLDGVPLGDMSYAAFNGLHISRAINSENLGQVELAQGAGTLDTPSSSNLGGTIKFSSVDPAADMGFQAATSFGSENTYRLFGRFETGELAHGVRGYVSAMHLDMPKWKGAGKNETTQANAKFLVPLGTDTTLTAFGSYSDYAQDDYMDMSKAIVGRYGWDWDYLRYDWATAVELARIYQANPSGDCSTNPYPNGIRCIDDTYYDGTTLRRDYLGYLRVDTRLSDTISLRVQPYYHNNRGEGTWWYPYSPTPGGANMFVRSSGYGIKRGGATASLTAVLGAHTVEFGGWYEHNKVMHARHKYGIDADGSNWDPRQWPHAADRFGSWYDFRYTVNTWEGFLQDSWQVTDAFKVDAGFKALSVGVESNTRFTTINQSEGKIRAKDLFLPQVGVNYELSSDLEAFAAYSENISAFGSGPFGTDQASFIQVQRDLKPESSHTIEGGVRFHLPRFEGLISAYHVTFKNRLGSFSPCSLIETCASITSNVGTVRTTGVELAGTYRFLRHFSLFGSYSYTDAKYADDTLNGAGEVVMETGDKRVIGTPEHIANAELGYDDGLVFGRANLGYQSKRFYTYSNEQSVPGRTLVDLTLGVRVPQGGALGGLEIQGTVSNLFDENYYAGTGSTNTDPNGTFQGLGIGAPRQVFVTLRKRF
jgi:iron complex outermembrane receptor protein